MKLISRSYNSIEDFCFPISEEKVFVNDKVTPYKAIVDERGRLISIVNESYKIVPNKEIIEPLMEQLGKYDNKWEIGSTSFLSNERMRLKVTFPDLIVEDSESKIELALHIHNSYDLSSGVYVAVGGIREICTNGMVFANVYRKLRRKHTRNFSSIPFLDMIHQIEDHIPELQNRIRLLEQQEFTQEKAKEIFKKLGKKAASLAGIDYKIDEETEEEIVTYNKALRLYAVYNILTNFATFGVKPHMSQVYDSKISEIFHI